MKQTQESIKVGNSHHLDTFAAPPVELVHDVSYVWYAQICVFGLLEGADRQLRRQKIGREVGFFRKDGSMVDAERNDVKTTS